MSDWSIRRVLAWTTEDFKGRGLGSPRLDAELLIAEVLGLDRVRMYMDLDRPLADEELAAIRALVVRRRAREPVAYILGRRGFYGRDFVVGPAVLVPRPETELVVERALALGGAEARVLDLCTGSGAIGLTLAAERPAWTVDLTDVSAEALAVARQNAEALGVEDRTRLLEGDLFAAVPEGARYDLVVANPPYIAAREVPELAPEVRDHEPRLALVSGESGFELHARLLEGVGAVLADGGAVLIEVGAGQAEELARRFREAGWAHAVTHPDLAGIGRVVEVAHVAPPPPPPRPVPEDDATEDDAHELPQGHLEEE